MSNKQSDDESVGLTVNWNKNGLTAKIKSRFVSALDRFGSRKVDSSGLEQERDVSLYRATTEAHLQIMQAATEALSDEVKKNPELARRALLAFEKASRKQDNVDGSLSCALEDLSEKSPLEPGAAESEAVKLDVEFLDRFEHYAESANTEQMRERWGRVLASEIRTPGRFSRKALRVVDEIDRDDAEIFERFCKSRIGSVVPTACKDITENEVDRLVVAGLVLDPGVGRSAPFERRKLADGTEVWFASFGQLAIAFLTSSTIRIAPSPFAGETALLFLQDGKANLPVNVLTQVGLAIAGILDNSERAALSNLVERFKESGAAESDVFAYEDKGNGSYGRY